MRNFSVVQGRRRALIALASMPLAMIPLSSRAAALIRRIDNRHLVDADGSAYYVIFCARVSEGAGVGHAFILWGKEDNTAMMSSNEAYGFYPETGTKAVFGSVPGQLRDEIAKNAVDAMKNVTSMLYVRVNQDDFTSSKSLFSQWETTDYSLYLKNCISFTRAVAQRIELIGFPEDVMVLPPTYYDRLNNSVETTFGGTWVSKPSRLQLKIDGPDVIWSEGRKLDANILNTNLIADASSTSKIIVVKRGTTDEVLKFLYPSFSPTLRAQILARNPEPTILSIERASKIIKAKWRRLGVKLRPDGTLDSILQPSAGPIFDVEFTR